MTWLDQLQRGQFRDAEFFTTSIANAIGRRTALHEYPLRDKPYTEDMGKKAREYTVECFVIGDDYMAARDLLTAALEKSGPGLLIHPYWGEIQAQVSSVRVHESSDEGRMARFNIVFNEAGNSQTPQQQLDTAQRLNQRIDNARITTQEDFIRDFNTQGHPAFVADDARQLLQQFATQLRSTADLPLDNPTPLAANIGALISNVNDQAELKSLFSFGDNLAEIAQTTPSRIAQLTNQNAVVNLVRRTALLESARLLV